MPNQVQDLKAAKVYNATLAALQAINHANGYNTQPMVCENRDAYNLESYQHVVEMYEGDPYLEVVQNESEASQTLLLDQHIMVVGLAYGERGDVVVEIHKLLQDVLGAVHRANSTICAAAGSAAFRIGSVTTDQGLLFNEGMASFNFTVSIGYFQDSDW